MEKHRFSVTVSDDVFQGIEDFRFGRRYQSRNDAVVVLIKAGIDAIERGLVDPADYSPDDETPTQSRGTE